MRKLKIAVIGSGSTYAPELVSGLIQHRDSLPVGTIALMDIDNAKNEIVSGLSRRMLDHAGLQDVQTILTDDLRVALEGADYVLTQIRVGCLDARIRDEKIPLRYGLLGQETTGAGGFMKAMRTIPVMKRIADLMEELCPNAFLINFTNPSGLVTEMLLNYTHVKAIGLCNCPINMLAEAKEFFHAGDDFDYDFYGLNHLCFLSAVYSGGKDVLAPLFDQPLAQSGLGKLLEDMEYTDTLIRTVRAIPCSYLQYYYFRDARVRKWMLAPETRGEECKRIEKELLKLYQDPTLVTKPAELDKRGGARYSEAAVSLLDALENDLNNIQTVDTRCMGVLPFMQENDVVEIKCRIGKNGATPIAPRDCSNVHISGLMQAVKAYERLAAKAGVYGDYEAAIGALTVHPLIGDSQRAEAVLLEMIRQNRDYLPQFAHVK